MSHSPNYILMTGSYKFGKFPLVDGFSVKQIFSDLNETQESAFRCVHSTERSLLQPKMAL